VPAQFKKVQRNKSKLMGPWIHSDWRHSEQPWFNCTYINDVVKMFFWTAVELRNPIILQVPPVNLLTLP